MGARDRLACLVLLASGGMVWLALVLVMVFVYPGSLEVKLAFAGVVGLAAGLTATPFAWLAAFGRRGQLTRSGDWPRAMRRGTFVAVLAALVTALQLTGTMSLPVVIFAFVLVAFVELTLSYRR